MYFWREGNWHPLGAKWVLAPEDYAVIDSASDDVKKADDSNTYLGYSVEPSCTSPFIPHALRPRGQAYILAKRLSYFTPGLESTAWPLSFLSSSSLSSPSSSTSPNNTEEIEVNFVAGALDDSTDPSMLTRLAPHLKAANTHIPTSVPENVRNFGLLDPGRFIEEVARSSVLVGVGNPVLLVCYLLSLILWRRRLMMLVALNFGRSPTPYEALCLGVPFINPILQVSTSPPSLPYSHSLLTFSFSPLSLARSPSPALSLARLSISPRARRSSLRLQHDPSNPQDRTKWITQHQGLQHLDPPYVYHVFKDDREGFREALRGALGRPIGRYAFHLFTSPDSACSTVH